jgi:hypothetical protein
MFRKFRLSKPRAAAGLILIAAPLAACNPDTAMLERVPEPLVASVRVGDYHNIRFDASDAASLRALANERISEVRRIYGDKLKGRSIDINYLSLSGGGGDGAYGAGVLVGWTASGHRPNFNVVTGISTGALIAPMAFLGPAYDERLNEAFTTVSTDEVQQGQNVLAVVGVGDSLSGAGGLEAMIARYLTPNMIEEIAAEHRKGRALLIGTTNLDSQRPIIWDIGAIAESGRPDSIDLIRTIIRASASISGVFPPAKIVVDADGKPYNELHVDGGVTRQVFLFPPGYDPKIVDAAVGWRPSRRAYIIRNAKVDPVYHLTQPELLPIASRSIGTLIKTQGVGDLYRIYTVSQLEKVDYNLTYIPSDFTAQSKSFLDEPYMRELFEIGYQEGRAGVHWFKKPPGLEGNPQ